VVHDGGRQTGCGVEQAAVGDHNANLTGLHASLVQQVPDGAEAGCLKLLACMLIVKVLWL
jgi:hypothetical protein